MPLYICLLRGINVGGKRMKMNDLYAMFNSLRYPDAQTLLASGNVILASDETAEELVPKIEAAIQAKFAFESKIIMRTIEELNAIIAKNPFQMADRKNNMLHISFLRDAATTENIRLFQETHNTAEEVLVMDHEIFVYYPEGAGHSKLNIEKQLRVIGTARNWNTVLKLQALAKKRLS